MNGTHIKPATANEIPRITNLLKDNALPTKGVENFLIALDQNGSWIGVAGLEVYGEEWFVAIRRR